MGTDRKHEYTVQVKWTGNTGSGTSTYRAYSRNHEISASGKPPIRGSADPAFRGDAARYNPEDMLVSSLSACHMLWYLHLCAEANIVVLEYIDEAAGTMIEGADGGGRFSSVVLKPRVVIASAEKRSLARQLHERAHKLCFIANSVNFPVACEPQTSVADDEGVNKRVEGDGTFRYTPPRDVRER
jgi:organic hydroperoxide reductase OsmC/OhrA